MPTLPAGVTAEGVCRVFNDLFRGRFNTELVGGGEEPFYQAATAGRGPHRVIFRHDYVASALHESAHWCIAGEARRGLDDYGYWYSPDGRDARAQRAFEAVEARPQALEWLFSAAAGVAFRVSVDNLDGAPECDGFPFKLAVWQALQGYLRQGLPPRAAAFQQALALAFKLPLELDPRHFQLADLG